MTKLTLLFIMVLTFGVIGFARHVHPSDVVYSDSSNWEDSTADKKKDEAIDVDVDSIPIEVIRNIKPTRFVPINSDAFFKTYTPCEEGFKRDLLGICREVWD